MLRGLILVCAFLVALGGGAAHGEDGQAAPPSVPSLTTAMRDGVLALPHLYGKPLVSESFKDKVVVVSFFASWCPFCLVEFRNLNAVDAAYGERGLEIVSINLFEEWGGFSGPAKLRVFLERFKPGFSVVKGDDRVAALFGGVRRIPTLFVFDRTGREVLHFVNEWGGTKRYVELEELKAAIESAL